MEQPLFNTLLRKEIQQMSQIALAEDIAGLSNSDITAELIPADKQATASIITREAGVLCGTAWVNQVFAQLSTTESKINIDWHFNDGDALKPNDKLCTLLGNARLLLTGERSAMNFLQTLSATATQTANYVDLIAGTDCQLLDTRKTLPGMRFGQKYAVTCGGGKNHRMGLSDAYLIKENHIMACGSIAAALNTARAQHPEQLLEIEVENLDELTQALDGLAQVIMLDNFSLADLVIAKQMRDAHSNKAKLEASGNVSPQTILVIAQTGVDYISVGSLTKNIQALDLSMRVTLD